MCEEVDERAVAAAVQVVLQTAARLEAQLRHVVAAVVSQQDRAAGPQEPRQPPHGRLVTAGADSGQWVAARTQ